MPPSFLKSAGRASEGLTMLELHQKKNVCTGAQLLLFNQGCLMVQRGNYLGALRVGDLLVGSLENAEDKIVSSFTNAALLLWLIGTCLSVPRLPLSY